MPLLCRHTIELRNTYSSRGVPDESSDTLPQKTEFLHSHAPFSLVALFETLHLLANAGVELPQGHSPLIPQIGRP